MKLKLWIGYVKIWGHDGDEVIIVAAKDYENARDVMFDVMLDDWDVVPDDVIEWNIYSGIPVNTAEGWFSMQAADVDTNELEIKLMGGSHE